MPCQSTRKRGCISSQCTGSYRPTGRGFTATIDPPRLVRGSAGRRPQSAPAKEVIFSQFGFATAAVDDEKLEKLGHQTEASRPSLQYATHVKILLFWVRLAAYLFCERNPKATI